MSIFTVLHAYIHIKMVSKVSYVKFGLVMCLVRELGMSQSGIIYFGLPTNLYGAETSANFVNSQL
jgi:hypothetical protein